MRTLAPLVWGWNDEDRHHYAETPFGRIKIDGPGERMGFEDLSGEWHQLFLHGEFKERYPTIAELQAAAEAHYVAVVESAFEPQAEVQWADTFDCERDEGTFTVTWPDGRWLVVSEDGTLVSGASPRREGYPAVRTTVDALRFASAPSQPESPAR
jgi:hypothetical protein